MPSLSLATTAFSVDGAACWPGKRASDLAGALLLSVALLPFLVAGIALSTLDTGRPFYRQERLGRGGRPFGCLKLRTMPVDADRTLARHLERNPEARAEWDSTRKLKSDPRVTRIGTFLRRTAMDEIPQLLNVLAGDMSLVGPRPVVRAEAAKYGDAWADYVRVRPGLTGLWQVSGRNDTTYDQRVAFDSDYVARCSPALDLSILLRTPGAVLSGKGAY